MELHHRPSLSAIAWDCFSGPTHSLWKPRVTPYLFHRPAQSIATAPHLGPIASADDKFAKLLADFPDVTTHFPTHFLRMGWSSSPPQMCQPSMHVHIGFHLISCNEPGKFRKMEELGIIRHLNSQWSSLLHMVPKLPVGWRPCRVFQCLNDATTPDCYPVPHIQDYTANLVGAKIFSKIDLVRGYHQIPVHTEISPRQPSSLHSV